MNSHETESKEPESKPFVDDVVRERWRREVGRARVQAALDHVQQAQRELARAMQDLYSVIGYAATGQQLSRLHDAVKRQWYRINERFERGPTRGNSYLNELDHAPNAAERANAHAGGCGHRDWRPTFMATPAPLAKDGAE